MDPKKPNRITGNSSDSSGVASQRGALETFLSSKSHVIPTTSVLQKFAASPSPSSSTSGQETPKISSRNYNGTVVLTSSPMNEAELQLYRVMQRASLLAYYDTLLEMGGDDVQQLCDAGEEEFLEIMALVGMASKPLHVRRLQKALQEWMTNPAPFQIPLNSNAATNSGSVSSLLEGIRPSSGSPVVSMTLPACKNIRTKPTATEVSPSMSPEPSQVMADQSIVRGPSPGSGSIRQDPASPSPSNPNPVLTDSQISRLSEAAEALVKNLPQFEPKPQNAKKKICRSLENVMKMAEDDPRRMDEIRKYAAIYGRFDCKRNPQKPLTLHEVSVNEAAAQICRFSPALLTRRDDLFSLARQVVRDTGYHYAKGPSSVPVACRTYPASPSHHLSKKAKVDSSSHVLIHSHGGDGVDSDRLKREERLERIAEELRILGDKTEELVRAAQQVRQTNDLPSAQNLQQQMEAVQKKQTQLLMEQSELSNQPLPSRFYRRNGSRLRRESEKRDADDADSQLSPSTLSSTSQEVGDSRDSLLANGNGIVSPSKVKTHSQSGNQVGPN